ncbi:MAG TPA: hypothetical protein VI542_25425 [Candidatus Tectomicrobia bacterium]
MRKMLWFLAVLVCVPYVVHAQTRVVVETKPDGKRQKVPFTSTFVCDRALRLEKIDDKLTANQCRLMQETTVKKRNPEMSETAALVACSKGTLRFDPSGWLMGCVCGGPFPQTFPLRGGGTTTCQPPESGSTTSIGFDSDGYAYRLP